MAGMNMASLTENTPDDYYTAQTNKLLRGFDQMTLRYRKALASHFGGEPLDETVREARN